jgi:hypothetical protein
MEPELELLSVAATLSYSDAVTFSSVVEIT